MKNIYLYLCTVLASTVLFVSCASLVRKPDEAVETTAPTTTPIVTSLETTTVITTHPWSTQTGLGIIETHSGHVITDVFNTEIKDGDKVLIKAKMMIPKVVFYDNESLEKTVNYNLSVIRYELEHAVLAICNRYTGSDPSLNISLPDVIVDYSLEYFTKEAMSLKFTIIETDNNGNVYKSYKCYNIGLTTGSLIETPTVFKDETLSEISTLIANALEKEGTYLFDNGKDLIMKNLATSWYISYNKLNVCFGPGEIAPVANGVITLSLEKDKFASLLSKYGEMLFTVNYEVAGHEDN